MSCRVSSSTVETELAQSHIECVLRAYSVPGSVPGSVLGDENQEVRNVHHVLRQFPA